MELVAEQVEVQGPHGPLLHPTSLRARTGEVLLVSGEPNSGRTALALVLSGRLRPTRGRVRCSGDLSAAVLRRRTDIVDAPDITEPDGAVPVHVATAEGLSLAGQRSSQRAVRGWLAERDLERWADDRFENLPGVLRTSLLLDLACESRTTQIVILDCPDRHGGTPRDWYALANRRAEQGWAVVVLCDPHSAERLRVEPAHIGTDNLPRTNESTTDTAEEAR